MSDLEPIEGLSASPPDAAFLNVARSATGRRWTERLSEPGLAAAHARKLGAPEALGRVLASRGVALSDGERFLSPTLRSEFPDPSSFQDMAAAAAILDDAIARSRPMAVFADYDVDGATSAAQLIRYARMRGHEIDLYVPDRIAEGYGPSEAAFAELKRRGAEVVVTVDCGATAHEPLEAAAAMGLEVVVVDHHQMTAEPPPAAALVNPNRPDDRSGCGHLAAAGVVFVLLAAINARARDRGAFSNAPEPDLLSLLDLTALGTFCDVVPLVGVNRAFAAQGLKVLSQREKPGVAALAEVAGAGEGAASGYTAGFVLGPRINAGGRVGRADLGARLLSTDDPAEARRIALELDALNKARREIEQAVLDEAIAKADALMARGDRAVIVTSGEGWHPGVIGIVAGRLKERFGKPAIVIALPEPGEFGAGKGSGRSVEGVDLGAAVAAARGAGLLIAGGGHAMAAGLSVMPETVEALDAFLNEHVASAGPTPPRVLMIDALLSVGGFTRDFAEVIQRAGPFGPGCPEPVFACADVRVASAREVGTGHLKVALTDASGRRLDAIAFRAADTGLDQVLGRVDARVHVAAKLKPGKGRYVDVIIEDAADAADAE